MLHMSFSVEPGVNGARQVPLALLYCVPPNYCVAVGERILGKVFCRIPST